MLCMSNSSLFDQQSRLECPWEKNTKIFIIIKSREIYIVIAYTLNQNYWTSLIFPKIYLNYVKLDSYTNMFMS